MGDYFKFLRSLWILIFDDFYLSSWATERYVESEDEKLIDYITVKEHQHAIVVHMYKKGRLEEKLQL